MVTKAELMEKIEALEAQVEELQEDIAELEASGGNVTHIHNHYHYPKQITRPWAPTYPYQPWVWGNGVTYSGTSTISSQSDVDLSQFDVNTSKLIG